jgi:hypothetical protein
MVSQVPRGEISLAASAYLAAHPELIAQVKPIVEQWRAEGRHHPKSPAPHGPKQQLNQ